MSRPRSFNQRKKDELAKGAMQRLAPFDPNSVHDHDRLSVEDWTGGYGDNDPDSVPRAPKEALIRGMHRLHGMTAVRKNPHTGEREFLLHRGMRPSQSHDFIRNGSPAGVSSWTPSHKKAKAFASDYLRDEISNPDVQEEFKRNGHKLDFSKPHVHSAWIPESQIHHIPNTIGSKSSEIDNLNWGEEDTPKAPLRRQEHEVMVKPHQFQVEQHPENHYDIHGEKDTIHTRINSRAPIKKSEAEILETLQKAIEEEHEVSDEDMKNENPDPNYDLKQLHGKHVEVYFNLHKHVWSVKHKGQVVAHADNVAVDKPKFLVAQAGRRNVQLQQKKNVHARVTGKLDANHTDFSDKTAKAREGVSYNPYHAAQQNQHGSFYHVADESRVHSADHVIMRAEPQKDGKPKGRVYAVKPKYNAKADDAHKDAYLKAIKKEHTLKKIAQIGHGVGLSSVGYGALVPESVDSKLHVMYSTAPLSFNNIKKLEMKKAEKDLKPGQSYNKIKKDEFGDDINVEPGPGGSFR